MYRRFLPHSLVGLGLALTLGACTAPDLSQPCPIPPDVTDPNDPRYVAALQKCFPASSENPVELRLKRDLDILFVIDNSSSMSPKQNELAKAIGNFITQIDTIANGGSYHVGVVTSDIGTWPGATLPPGFTNDVFCGSQKGDDGLLQNLPCTTRIKNFMQKNPTLGISPDFQQACQGPAGMPNLGLCPDDTFVPTDRWIANDNGVNNIAGHATDPTAPIKAFKCIGLVGDLGCGVEGQLESGKRALDGHLLENSGFLRPNSVLAVIWITDEDDCSVQPAQRINLNPLKNTDTKVCPQGVADPDFPCYDVDYRCIAKDLECDSSTPLSTSGVKTGCKERQDSWLIPLQVYAKFFGSLRTDPNKLVLAGIWSPSLTAHYAGAPDGQLDVEIANGASNTVANLNRGQKTQAACFDPAIVTQDTKGYFGQAQLRLEEFRKRFDPNTFPEESICNVSKYQDVLSSIAAKIQNAGDKDCLSVKPNVDSNGTPACLVGFVDTTQPSALPDSYLPVCSSGCCAAWGNSPAPIGTYNGMISKDPAIRNACINEPADCYCAAPSALCSKTALAGVWIKDDMPPPAQKEASFRCSGVRPPN